MLGIQLVNVTVVRIIFLSTTKTNFYGIRCYSCVKINGKRMFAVVVKKYNVNEFDPFLLWRAFWMATTFSWMLLYVQLKAQPAIKYLIFFTKPLVKNKRYRYIFITDIQICSHTLTHTQCYDYRVCNLMT